jgi:hypothetical protein
MGSHHKFIIVIRSSNWTRKNIISNRRWNRAGLNTLLHSPLSTLHSPPFSSAFKNSSKTPHLFISDAVDVEKDSLANTNSTMGTPEPVPSILVLCFALTESTSRCIRNISIMTPGEALAASSRSNPLRAFVPIINCLVLLYGVFFIVFRNVEFPRCQLVAFVGPKRAVPETGSCFCPARRSLCHRRTEVECQTGAILVHFPFLLSCPSQY